jgi:hypothetical protein
MHKQNNRASPVSLKKQSKRKLTTKPVKKTKKTQQMVPLPTTTTITTTSLTTESPFTTSMATMAYKPRPRVIQAGLPKGLPPKVVQQIVKLTPAEMQAEEDRQRFVVKEFYKTKAKWTPHPKLVACNDLVAFERYLWDHHVRLRWFRGKIADTPNHDVRRSYLRTHISIHKKTVKYIEDRIFALQGRLRIPKLFDPLVPNYHDKINPFLNQIAIVERVKRDYDYPMKDVYEPLAQEGKKWEGSLAAKVQQI